MANHTYEVVQNSSGWVLRRQRTELVEFPTQGQALRAAIAVSRDEGLPFVRICSADGAVQEIDPRTMELDAFEV